ncbi:MAG TPA: hypothetical protein GXZ59_07690 [Clostridiaceae bacterium]|nr:hypothetical protein [Clostridiaceae bacterium]
MDNEIDLDLDLDLVAETINDTLPSLTMYVRDVNLDAKIAAMYKPGMIIREPGFTDASSLNMGMITTHRYAILSNHMSDFAEFKHEKDWGLFVAERDSHFKVLDVYEFEGRIQILLLHLPDDNRWRLFEQIVIDIEEELVSTGRVHFESSSLLAPVAALTSRDWLNRTLNPLGISDEGEIFEL